MRIIYSTSDDKRKYMFEVIDGIAFARMVETDLIELQLSSQTEDANGVVYIELRNEEVARQTIYRLFESGRADLTSEWTRIHYTNGTYYDDEEDEELERRLEEDDWDDDDEDEDDDLDEDDEDDDFWNDDADDKEDDNDESVDKDIIAEGYSEYHGQSSGIIPKTPRKEEPKKRFSFGKKKGKYDL